MDTITSNLGWNQAKVSRVTSRPKDAPQGKGHCVVTWLEVQVECYVRALSALSVLRPFDAMGI